ncbi:hypothetical protein L103DPR2_02330 [Limnohabitans sp. 103DPR2]|nr:hypothetical protein L103DPR2_02330 [Limnohabitans sp. 103DPR2]
MRFSKNKHLENMYFADLSLAAVITTLPTLMLKIIFGNPDTIPYPHPQFIGEAPPDRLITVQ